MPENSRVRRCVPVVGPVLLLCLMLALPGAAFAAEGEGAETTDSTRELTRPEGGEGSSRSEEDSTTGTSPDGDREEGTEPGPDGSADAEEPRPSAGSRPARPSRPARSRASRAAGAKRERSGSNGLDLEHLDGLRDAIRRKTRSRTEGVRRRVRRSVEATRPGARGERRQDRQRDRAAESGEKDAISVSVASEERIELYPGSHHIRVGRRVLVQGYEPPRRAGRKVVLEVLSAGRWVAVDVATTVEGGRFELDWTPKRPGRYQARARPYSSRSTVEPSGVRRLFIYRSAVASWYGPGFYGNRTACGQTFTSRLMGVAHKTLPCGYLVRIRYNGRSKTVPVVDRGPYVDGRDYDLTEALRNYLGFDGVGRVWATA